MPALGRPVHISKVDGQRELVQNEGGSDAEPDRQQIDADVSRLERDLEHAATEDQDVADDHVMQMDVADAAAPPAADARGARVQPCDREGRERRREHQEERLTSCEAEAMEPDRVEGEHHHRRP